MSALDSPESHKPDADAALAQQLDYALKHFLFIADQRIKTFHFYVLLLAASGGATLQLMDKFSRTHFLCVAGFHVLIVAVFFLIEQRNTRLIKICKKALRRIEKKRGWPRASRLADTDEALRNGIVSYRGAISISFFAQLILAGALAWCAIFVNHPEKETSAKVPATIQSQVHQLPPAPAQPSQSRAEPTPPAAKIEKSNL